MLRHPDHAEVLAVRRENPEAARAGDVDVALLVALHAVDHAVLQHAVADVLGEHATVGERAVLGHVEHPDVAARGVVDVEDALVRREAEPVRLVEVVGLAVEFAVGRDAENPLEAQLPLALQAEDRHAAVPRVGEVDRAVGLHHHVIGAVQLLAVVVRGQHLALAGRRLAGQCAGHMLADIEIEVGIQRHAVALVVGVAHVARAVHRAPAPTCILRDIAEVETLLAGVPDRPLGKREARANLVDGGVLGHEIQKPR